MREALRSSGKVGAVYASATGMTYIEDVVEENCVEGIPSGTTGWMQMEDGTRVQVCRSLISHSAGVWRKL